MLRHLALAACFVVLLPVAASAGTAPSGTITGPYGGANLHDSVTFQTTSAGGKGWQYPMVDLECMQAGVTVYSQLDHPDATFALGGGSSVWLTNGGPADCTAILDFYGYHGGIWTVTFLDSTSWQAGG
jgi:hypothetical protein